MNLPCFVRSIVPVPYCLIASPIDEQREPLERVRVPTAVPRESVAREAAASRASPELGDEAACCARSRGVGRRAPRGGERCRAPCSYRARLRQCLHGGYHFGVGPEPL